MADAQAKVEKTSEVSQSAPAPSTISKQPEKKNSESEKKLLDPKKLEEVKEEGKTQLKDTLSYKENNNRKKLSLNGTEYYIVNLDEVNEYAALKETYKEDSMSAFILYMHSEFVKDLNGIRRKKKMKSVGTALFAIIALTIIAILIVLAIKMYK